MEACGQNIICRFEVFISTTAAQVFSLFDTIIDNWVPIALILLVLVLLWKGYLKIREGTNWQDLAKWVWGNFVTVTLVLLVGAGILLGLILVFPDVFGRAGDAFRDLLGLKVTVEGEALWLISRIF